MRAVQSARFRRFAALAGGTAAGQVLMFTALPVISHFYTPAEFGFLAAFTSLILLVLPAACLRFDLAIPIPTENSEAVAVGVMAVISATLFPCAYLLALFLTKGFWGSDVLQITEEYGWLIFVALWSAALFSVVQYWAIRAKSFKSLAFSHIFRGLSGAGTQIGLGVVGFGTVGLLLGQAIYMGLGAVSLTYSVLRQNLLELRQLTRGALLSAARKNWRFPVFSTPEALLNSISANLPMLIIVSYFGVEVGGALYLAQRLTSIPTGLIGGSLSRVYLAEAPSIDRAGQLFAFTIKLQASLFLITLPIVILVAVFAPHAIETVFGQQWASAARYLVWLLPAALFQFTVVPVSSVLHIRSRQLVALVLQAFGLLFQVGSIWYCYVTSRIDPVLGFAIGSAFHYAIYNMVVLYISRDLPRTSTRDMQH